MNGKVALGVLLLMAGGLIYAASHHQQEAAQSSVPQEFRGEGTRLSHADGMAPHRRAHQQLAWLGPIESLDKDALTRRMHRVMDQVRQDVAAVQDPVGFECKEPAEVGPVPLLDAVDAWLDGFPDSRRDRTLTRNLYRAAEQGNWLARVQVYTLLAERPARDSSTAYRTMQLMEWLQQHGIGALHGLVGEALTGRPPAGAARAITRSDLFAALHHSYPAQNKVGHELRRSGDPRLAAVGQKMMDCAAHALPAYARMFGADDAPTAH